MSSTDSKNDDNTGYKPHPQLQQETCDANHDSSTPYKSDGGREDNNITSSSGDDRVSSCQPDTNDDTTSDEHRSTRSSNDDKVSSQYDTTDDTDTVSYEYRPTSTRTESSLSLGRESLTTEVSFSVQLWNMLNRETDAGRDAVQWLRNGNGFVINRQNEFEQNILPKYFGDSPCIFQSFVRRLYRWGFKQADRSTAGSGVHVFTSEVFHRDNEMYLEMKALPRRTKKPRRETAQTIESHDKKAPPGTQHLAGIQSLSGDNPKQQALSSQQVLAPHNPLHHFDSRVPQYPQSNLEQQSQLGSNERQESTTSMRNELVQQQQPVNDTSSSMILSPLLLRNLTGMIQQQPINAHSAFLIQQQLLQQNIQRQGQAGNFVPPPTARNVDMIQLPSSLQGYSISSQVQQSALQILLQASAGAPQSTATTTPILPSGQDTTTSSDNNTSSSNDPTSTRASSFNEDQQMSESLDNRKRDRSPSSDS